MAARIRSPWTRRDSVEPVLETLLLAVEQPFPTGAPHTGQVTESF